MKNKIIINGFLSFIIFVASILTIILQIIDIQYFRVNYEIPRILASLLVIFTQFHSLLMIKPELIEHIQYFKNEFMRMFNIQQVSQNIRHEPKILLSTAMIQSLINEIHSWIKNTDSNQIESIFIVFTNLFLIGNSQIWFKADVQWIEIEEGDYDKKIFENRRNLFQQEFDTDIQDNENDNEYGFNN